MDNITMEKTEKEVPSQQPQQPDLNNLVIADENTAILNNFFIIHPLFVIK